MYVHLNLWWGWKFACSLAMPDAIATAAVAVADICCTLSTAWPNSVASQSFGTPCFHHRWKCIDMVGRQTVLHVLTTGGSALTWCAVCARLLLLMASTTSSLVALCATSRALRKSSCSLSSWPLLTFGLSRLVTAVVHCCRSLLSCTAVVHCCRALDPTPYIRLRLCPCVYILLCECYTGSCACLCDQTSRVGCFLEAAFYA